MCIYIVQFTTNYIYTKVDEDTLLLTAGCNKWFTISLQSLEFFMKLGYFLSFFFFLIHSSLYNKELLVILKQKHKRYFRVKKAHAIRFSLSNLSVCMSNLLQQYKVSLRKATGLIICMYLHTSESSVSIINRNCHYQWGRRFRNDQ